MPLHIDQRISYAFLCAVPFLAVALAAVRALRVPGVYQTIGAVQFAAVGLAAWTLGAQAIRASSQDRQRLALAGALLVVPFGLVSLLWVGIGPPWVATPTENRMRYLVLLAGSMAVAGAFVALRDAISEAGERLYSTLGFAAIMLASPPYVIFAAIQLGAYHTEKQASSGQVPPWCASLAELSLILLFFGVVLTYLATAAFAAALRRTGWLGRTASRAFVGTSFFAILWLLIAKWRSLYWFDFPGFFFAVPAVPWIMPHLLGVILLRRGGDASLTKGA